MDRRVRVAFSSMSASDDRLWRTDWFPSVEAAMEFVRLFAGAVHVWGIEDEDGNVV